MYIYQATNNTLLQSHNPPLDKNFYMNFLFLACSKCGSSHLLARYLRCWNFMVMVVVQSLSGCDIMITFLSWLSRVSWIRLSYKIICHLKILPWKWVGGEGGSKKWGVTQNGWLFLKWVQGWVLNPSTNCDIINMRKIKERKINVNYFTK